MIQSDTRHEKEAPCSCCAPGHKGCSGAREPQSQHRKSDTHCRLKAHRVAGPKTQGLRRREGDPRQGAAKHWAPLSGGKTGDKVRGDRGSAGRSSGGSPGKKGQPSGGGKGRCGKGAEAGCGSGRGRRHGGRGLGLVTKGRGRASRRSKLEKTERRGAWPGRGEQGASVTCIV